jgi:hypothetical protein
LALLLTCAVEFDFPPRHKKAGARKGRRYKASTNYRHQRSDTMSASKKTIGYAVQLAGIGAFAVGAILSLHHAAIAAAFAGGAAAFYVGEKIRTLA